jgi:hypothetical protein
MSDIADIGVGGVGPNIGRGGHQMSGALTNVTFLFHSCPFTIILHFHVLTLQLWYKIESTLY